MKRRKWLLAVNLTWLLLAGCTTQPAVNDGDGSRQTLPNNPVTERVPVVIGNAQVMAEIRETEAERALGLSYREMLGENEGMVFVFDQPAPYSFWMKGMNFPLDMIWVRDGRVVDMDLMVPAPWSAQNEQPETRTPNEPVDMVIEVNGGWVKQNGVKVGDEVKL